MIRIYVQGNTRDDVLVDFEYEETLDVFFDGREVSMEKFLSFDRTANQTVHEARVGVRGGSNLLVVVAVNKGAHAVARKYLIQ